MKPPKWIEWGELYEYLETYIKFGDGKSTPMSMTCKSDLHCVKDFCYNKKINFEKVKVVCEQFGGFCDCEVLLNVTDDCDDKLPIVGQINMKEAGD